jgi:hypothetical protein
VIKGCVFRKAALFWIIDRSLRGCREFYGPASRQTSIPPLSPNDYHCVVMAVVMMMTPMTVAIRLRISGSREEGKESKYQ